MLLRLISVVLGITLFSGQARSAPKELQWTGWLGPERNGWVQGFQPPKAWPEKLKQVWQVKVGSGYGSPLVSGGRVYQHARQGGDEVVWCLDLDTGKVRWRKTEPTPFKAAAGGQYHGTGPKACPVLSEGRLFTMSITGILTARDAESGRRLWQFDPGSRFKKRHPRWGASTSPIVDGNRVIAHFGTDFDGCGRLESWWNLCTQKTVFVFAVKTLPLTPERKDVRLSTVAS